MPCWSVEAPSPLSNDRNTELLFLVKFQLQRASLLPLFRLPFTGHLSHHLCWLAAVRSRHCHHQQRSGEGAAASRVVTSFNPSIWAPPFSISLWFSVLICRAIHRFHESWQVTRRLSFSRRYRVSSSADVISLVQWVMFCAPVYFSLSSDGSRRCSFFTLRLCPSRWLWAPLILRSVDSQMSTDDFRPATITCNILAPTLQVKCVF